MATTSDPLERFYELEANDDQGATSLADEALGEIAKTGRVHHQWNHLKPVLIFKLRKNLKLAFPDLGPSESENVDQCDELLERLSSFSNPPFTIQRLCELLVFPCKHYNRTDKYLRALERVLMVVTYAEPELGGEQRVPPLTSVPTDKLIRGGGGGEGGGCTSPAGAGLEDSRGDRKRELATVELQEADSTVEGAEDDAETPTKKKTKWEQGQEGSPAHLPTTEQGMDEMGTTPGGLSTEVLPGSGSTDNLPGGGSTEILPGGVSTGSPWGQVPTGRCHKGPSSHFSMQDCPAVQGCSAVSQVADEQQPMEVGEAEGGSSKCSANREPRCRPLTQHTVPE